MSIILCGLPGSGKTTIGNLLANKLQLPFLDTDHLIEIRHQLLFNEKMSCRDIYAKKGEHFFRNLENEIIQNLSLEPSIISLGGGSLLLEENLKHIQAIGQIFYLKCSVQTLLSRVLANGHPAYLAADHPERSFIILANRRTPLYEQVSTSIIETDNQSIDAIVQEIINQQALHGK